MKVRLFVVGMALAMLLVTAASSASAATWSASAPTTTTVRATATTSTYLSVNSVVLGCTTAVVDLTASTTSVITGPASTGPWNHVPAGGTPSGNTLRVTPRFSSCTQAGTPYTVRCNSDEASPTSPSAFLNASSTTARAARDGGVTTGSLSSVDCQIFLGSTLCTTVTSTGSSPSGFTDNIGVTGTYTNPNSTGSAAGRVTINGSGQTLTSRRPSGGTCVIGDGAATFTSDSTGRAANVAYTVPFASAASIWVA